jgi:pSer/pThr/pTyr-binding forkhead associated (FHA) protein
LLFTEGKLEVQDLKSRNGTLVNGQIIKGVQRLEVGDRVTIGDEVLVMLAEPPARGSSERTVDMGGPYRTPRTDPPQQHEQEDTLIHDLTEAEKKS